MGFTDRTRKTAEAFFMAFGVLMTLLVLEQFLFLFFGGSWPAKTSIRDLGFYESWGVMSFVQEWITVVHGFAYFACQQLGLSGSFLAACILAPLLEEIEFRGPLLLLRRHVSSPWVCSLAACVLGTIFACAHPVPLLVLPILFAFALCATWLAFKTGRLLPAMLLHAAYNAHVILP